MGCKSQDPQQLPGSACRAHSSPAVLAEGIGIGPGRVPQVKGATWAWAAFRVKAVAFPQAHAR